MDSLTSILLLLELQHEFSGLKVPGRLAKFGPPFRPSEEFADAEDSPVMKMIAQSYIFTPTLPGVNKAPPEFWSDKLQPLLETIGKHNLSDSYDHGRVSKRKMVGFAVVVVLHVLSKGLLGKATPLSEDRKPTSNNEEEDDADEAKSSNADSSTDSVQKSLANVNMDDANGPERLHYPSVKRLREAYSLLVYGDGLQQALDRISVSEDVDSWDEPLRSVIENIRYTIAVILHFSFVTVDAIPESPHLVSNRKGPEGVVERLYNRIPWFLTRQVLRVGNAGLLMSGLTRLFLMKPLSWFGESRNLLQTMLAGIFNADLEHSESTMVETDAEFEDDAKWETMRKALQWFTQLSRTEQDDVRSQSINKELNITIAILEAYEAQQTETTETEGVDKEDSDKASSVQGNEDEVPDTASETEHSEIEDFHFDPYSEKGVHIAMRYFDAALTHRDRECLIHDLCDNDQLNDVVREFMNAFYNIIYEAHQAADFSQAIYDFQYFLWDVIQLSKAGAPLVKFINLVERYQSCFVRFIHRLVVNAPDLCGEWCDWYRHCLKQFSVEVKTPDAVDVAHKALNTLDEETKHQVLEEIGDYVKELDEESKKAIENKDSTSEWLLHLYNFFGSAIITPTTAHGVPQPQLPNCGMKLNRTKEKLLTPFRNLLMEQLNELQAKNQETPSEMTSTE
ncbi:DUF3818 and PXA domain conserved fungal protein [Schizosaccharomyces pombe]|uniref:Uncharacterized protein C663.15c n=1 Tax=Schizosaccharomyces pombe (strain 972 / ATCC 24843) TaxID=284812 RepID=YCPF_SCHPO|nr:uncharacterized protein SPCC663.15c [Schizosaccharomyces pombe]O74521.2 RecName: Full=Uncharacterized protein C663.15c [Schizosaccharomyces pombe 972h-]CAA20375.2 conserved fungal protein [Schizosaccharomyces pombe]|eukprot:NP_588276.2 uncharacterized protein SPCC663.15c [Schizosaccharomyces pombe]